MAFIQRCINMDTTSCIDLMRRCVDVMCPLGWYLHYPRTDTFILFAAFSHGLYFEALRILRVTYINTTRLHLIAWVFAAYPVGTFAWLHYQKARDTRPFFFFGNVFVQIWCPHPYSRLTSCLSIRTKLELVFVKHYAPNCLTLTLFDSNTA